MKLRGISPMQPICEICDEALDSDGVGRVFQNSFYHNACFHRDRGKLGQDPGGSRRLDRRMKRAFHRPTAAIPARPSGQDSEF